mgnify:CR=1 FL=1
MRKTKEEIEILTTTLKAALDYALESGFVTREQIAETMQGVAAYQLEEETLFNNLEALKDDAAAYKLAEEVGLRKLESLQDKLLSSYDNIGFT